MRTAAPCSTAFAVGWRPRDSIFSADGSRAYVSSEHGGSVAVVDVATSEVLETIPLPAGSLPMGLALSPDGERLYVANGRARTVSVIDLATLERRRATCGSALARGASGSRPTASSCTRPTARRTTFRSSTRRR